MQFREKLKAIAIPVLAIWGENDRAVPLEHAELLTQSVKQGRKIIIPGAGHAPYMNQPEVFHRELLEFLSGIT